MFVNVAGGVRVDEPGADLAVALAVASAHRGEPLADADGRPLACFGEVGLTGELRAVAHAERRIAEALKFGLGPVLAPPPATASRASTARPADRAAGATPRLAGCERLRRATCRPCAPMRGSGSDADALDKRQSELSTRDSAGRLASRAFAIMAQVPHTGDELNELEARQDPRLLRALDMVAPGTPLREGIDNIIHSRTGGLILIAEADEVSFLFSGGIRLDVDYTPGAALPGGEDGRGDRAAAAAPSDLLGERAADARPDDPLDGDRHPPPHRRARLQADRRRW